MSAAGDAIREAVDARRVELMRDKAVTPLRVKCKRCGDAWGSHDALSPFKAAECRGFVTPTPNPWPDILPEDADAMRLRLAAVPR